MELNIGDLKDYTLECKKLEEQILYLDKQIADVSVRITKLGAESKLGVMLVKRRSLMEDEKKYLVSTVKELRESISKMTFGNYISTVDEEEFEAPKEDVKIDKKLDEEAKSFDYNEYKKNNTEKETTLNATVVDNKIIISKEEKEVEKKEESIPEVQEVEAKTYSDKRLKVVFTGDKYRFYIKLRDGNTEIMDAPVAKRFLRYKKLVKRTANRYHIDKKNIKNIDLNLFFGLINVDYEFNTNYSDDYLDGILDAELIYNNNKLVMSKKFSIKEKIKQYLISLRQKKYANAQINHAKPVFASLSLLAALSVFSLVGVAKNHESDSTSYGVEATSEKDTEEPITEEVKIVVREAKKENTSENNGFKLDDRFRLVYKDDSGKVTKSYEVSSDISGHDKKSTADFGCDYFKISGIYAFLNGSNVASITNNNHEELTTNELYRKYGSDIDIYLDFDGYNKGEDTPVCESIGFINIDELAFFTKEQKRDIAMSESPTEEKKVKNTVFTTENATDIADIPVVSDVTSYGSSTTEEVTTEVASTEENKKSTSEINGYGINDKVRLVTRNADNVVTKSVQLYADAWSSGHSISASDINCDYFKISYIAVYRGSEILDTIQVDSDNNDLKTNDLYKKYGSDIDIAFNFDAYVKSIGFDKCVCEYAGWVNIDQLVHRTPEQKQKLAGEKVLTLK